MGESMDMVVTGIIDLLLKDANGNVIAVDNKTAKKPYAQATVDTDLQLISYAYLLASNKFVFPTTDVYCRFDVMRKLKKLKFEQPYTIRTAAQRRRFASGSTPFASSRWIASSRCAASSGNASAMDPNVWTA